MDPEELREEVDHAEVLIEEEASRDKATGALPDPGRPHARSQDSDLVSLRKRYKFLDGFSDSFIRSNTLGDLMKMESTAIKVKQWEKSKDAEDRLATNKAALTSTTTDVSAGRDNRMSLLHPARFLAGAGCSAKKLWLAAKESIGDEQFPPIGCYDMGAVGLAGYVSAKGWSELHNMASTKLSIKLFNINNCGSKSNKKEAGSDEFSETAEFKLALRVMRTAFAIALPWNLSVLALEGFFFQNNFCQNDLHKVEKKAWFLTKFTDYVLQQNADRWRDGEAFLSTGELKTTWTSFFGAQPQSLVKEKEQPKQSKSDKSDKSKTGPPKPYDAKAALGICYAYNQGTCSKTNGSCSTAKGRPLKHVCDHVADPTKPTAICGKDHVRKDNH